MQNLLNRKNQRLKEYNYLENGCYFITICTNERENYFGKIEEWNMILNEFWKIAEKTFVQSPEHYTNCRSNEYIVMPNHFHWIIEINNEIMRTGLKPVPTKNKEHWLSEIIRWFKTFSSRKINEIQNDFRFSWQRSFYDRIIRNEDELNKIKQYIIDNPLKWEFDKNYKA